MLHKLHEKINVSGLLTNAEAWTLLKGERKDLDQIELSTIKNLFDLPVNTPNPGIIYTLGLLYANIRVDQRQFMYLHKVLNRDASHWTRKSLQTLTDLNIGWYKNLNCILEEYQLTKDFEQIRKMTRPHWKHLVREAIEKKNTEKLIEECYKTTDGEKKEKRKTAHIIEKITAKTYKRQPLPEIMMFSKIETKTLITARFGMLECGHNYKGTLSSECVICKCLDDEEHRMNHCKKLAEVNYHDQAGKVNFDTIYTNDVDTLKIIVERISHVWNVETAHGTNYLLNEM